MTNNNLRLALNIFWIILGAVLVALGVLEIVDSPMFSGMGGGLMAVGMLQAARNIKYRKDPEYRAKADIEMNDERNSFLRAKSWTWTGYIVVLTESIGIAAAMALGQEELSRILSFSVCLIVGVYWITYMILNKKY